MPHEENKMGTMSMPKLVINMSFPIMMSMLVQAMYNIVDSVFVAKFDPRCMTAISLAFPIQSLMIAFSVGTSVGMNSLLSRRLGEKHFDDANATAMNGLFISFITSLFFAVFGAFFSHPFIAAFTEDAQTAQMGADYLRICAGLSTFIFMQVSLERMLQSTGRSVLSMVSQLTGAVINIILDPILIFGLLGFPRLGISGAAIATVIGQFASMIVALVLNVTKNKEIKLGKFLPSLRIIKEIYAVGIPAIVMQSITSVMTIGMNKILGSDMAVSVFGIYFKLQSFIFMPVFGLNSGLIPIIAYNYGARNKERITSAIRIGVILAVSIMVVGCAVFELFPSQLLMLFNAKPETMKLGVAALRIIAVHFPLAGFGIVCSSTFQALGDGVLSLIQSMLRQLVGILPAAWILNHFLGTYYVWLSFPIAELLGFAFSLGALIFIYKKKLSAL